MCTRPPSSVQMCTSVGRCGENVYSHVGVRSVPWCALLCPAVACRATLSGAGRAVPCLAGDFAARRHAVPFCLMPLAAPVDRVAPCDAVPCRAAPWLAALGRAASFRALVYVRNARSVPCVTHRHVVFPPRCCGGMRCEHLPRRAAPRSALAVVWLPICTFGWCGEGALSVQSFLGAHILRFVIHEITATAEKYNDECQLLAPCTTEIVWTAHIGNRDVGKPAEGPHKYVMHRA